MRTPEVLQAGDTVAIVSTARKISKAELAPAMELLSQWGLQYVLGETIGASEDQFAGDDTLRAKDFQQMMDDPNIKAIWCARGGYGTVRIIDQLDFSKFIKNPKWIIGYSDVTVLHSHLHSLGVSSLHAAMPLHIEKKTKETEESLRKALFGKSYTIETSAHPLNRNGTSEGMLVGGNLSILYSLCGSASTLDTRGKILFLEDLDEYLYHIDRMMQNLKRNGMLKDLVGLVVGGMTQMNDNTIPFGKTAEEIIAETVKEYNYPVCFGFPAGHGEGNEAMMMGKKVKLVVDKHTTLTF